MNITSKIIFKISNFNDLLRGFKLISTVSFLKEAREQCFIVKKKEEYLTPYKNLSSLSNNQLIQPKRKFIKKKKVPDGDLNGFCVTAYSTAEEYDLESLSQALPTFTSFKPTAFSSEVGNLADCVHAVKSLGTETESQHLFFFREGTIVMWNIPNSEVKKLLDFVKLHEENSFNDEVIENESEKMTYSYSSDLNKTGIIKDSLIFAPNVDLNLEKYAISNAMSLSVHLGTYETNLEQYIKTMEPVTEDLKAGAKIKMSREEVLRKTGQLFALRHNISLSSDLLDTPDFYWDRGELENLYQLTFNYFCINKRTRVMNEKINHCIELVQLLSSHLNDKHHVRLEWMIIVLIMVEVAFEIVHYINRFLEFQEKQSPLL